MQWIVDGIIPLTQLCTTAKWKFKDCITALIAEGLSTEDAVIFARFAFGTDAVYQRAVSDEFLTIENYKRLSITSSDPAEHSAGPPL